MTKDAKRIERLETIIGRQNNNMTILYAKYVKALAELERLKSAKGKRRRRHRRKDQSK